MNNETNTISLDPKKDFILKYLFDNFSTSKEEFLNNNDILEKYFNEQLQSYSITNCDYFFIKIEFNDNGLLFKYCNATDNFNDNKFFLIKGLDENERNIFKQFNDEDFLEKSNFFDKIIMKKNDLISLILQFTNQEISFQDLFFSEFNNSFVEKLYEIIYHKSILDNF